MNLPFTADQFFEVFRQYNSAIYPIIILLYLAVGLSLFLIYSKKDSAGRFSSALLAFLWLLMGVLYHIIFFSQINKAAYIFGLLFVIQALLFLIFGVIKNRIQFVLPKGIYFWLGWFFIIFGLFIYPVIGLLTGHEIGSMPLFGAPCPTVIFTFGLLLFTNNKLPKYLLIIPALWSVIGFMAALSLGVIQDVVLLVAGITATLILSIIKK
jgi:tryptophan-rich sensory protein